MILTGKWSKIVILIVVFNCSLIWIHAYAKIQNGSGHYFYDDSLPVYLHGAGNGFILLDSTSSIETHNFWYTSKGANANRVKGFQGINKEGVAPWICTESSKNGKKRYDLLKFNPAYWARLVEYARDMKNRHGYFIFQFFDGELLTKGNWPHHPFNGANNVNWIDVKGDPLCGFYDTKNKGLLRVQKLYMEEIVKILTPFGNVVFELSTNYSGDLEWQREISNFLHELGLKYGSPVPVINDIPEEFMEASTNDLDGFDIHQIAQGMTPEEFSAFISRIWKFNKPVLNSYAVLGQGGSFQGKDWMERLILTLWLHRVHGVQFGGVGPKPSSLMHIQDFNFDAFRAFHLAIQNLAFWSMEPHHELTSAGWCIAAPGHEYLTLVIDEVPDITLDFSAVNQQLGYLMMNPITLKSDAKMVRESTPVSDKHTFPNIVSGPMVLVNADGIARHPNEKVTNDIHIAWQANRKIYHKMKRLGEWCATDVISPSDVVLCKHVQMDIDDDRNIYI